MRERFKIRNIRYQPRTPRPTVCRLILIIFTSSLLSTFLFQTEFNTLNSTLTQLTNQKNVAQKRLDDLDGQVRLCQHAKALTTVCGHIQILRNRFNFYLHLLLFILYSLVYFFLIFHLFYFNFLFISDIRRAV